MADDLTAGGVPVYRDTGGVLREMPRVAVSGSAEPTSGTNDALPKIAKGYQQLTSAQLATVQSLAVPSGATRAVLQSNGVQAVRWRDDGIDPSAPADSSAGTGQRIEAGDSKDYTGNLSNVRMIGEGAGTVVDILYYG
jgi:hypothetical protein